MEEFHSGRSRLERKRQEGLHESEEHPHGEQEHEPNEASPRQERSASQRYLDDPPIERKKQMENARQTTGKRRLQVGFGTVLRSGNRFAVVVKNRLNQRRSSRNRRTDEPITSRSSDRALKKQPVAKKKRRFKGKIIGLIMLILIGLIVFGSQPFTFLLIGSDARPGESLRGSRSDSLSVMQFVPLSRTIQLTSIPRDTYTPIACEDGKKDKITHAFAYGGEDCTSSAVSELLDQDIDSKIVISFDSFIGLIDEIGGIDLVSTGTFSEQDASGKANQYTFQKGKEYHMDGAMALAYSRHRKSDTDVARANRQSEVIQAVATDLMKPTGWSSIPDANRYMKEEMNLDVSVRQMMTAGLSLALLSEREHLEVEGVSERMNGIFYDFPKKKELKELRVKLDTTFYGTLKND
ncbi:MULTISPECIES: LCP family protein [Exiguobacterium]|uniref:LCP family protein n=1 Tax=Exiguobacterium antarcticum TaxID=132920 RepID=A0ABT6R4Z9_9BACL|nr:MULTISPECIES: LCP family protein [Exiguobacterium]MCT4781555.1 LCP family protein [Exiguobacterium soli]MDI3236011.1 LCP family protein [Exiguobacterium antarcticum]